MHMTRNGRSKVGSAGRSHRTSGLCRRAIRYRRLTPIYSIGIARRSVMVNPILAMKPCGVYKSIARCACKMEERNSGCPLLHLFGCRSLKRVSSAVAFACASAARWPPPFPAAHPSSATAASVATDAIRGCSNFARCGTAVIPSGRAPLCARNILTIASGAG